MQPDTTVQPDDSDVRFGHDWADVQDENGVDLSLLRYNLQHSVEERLLALESYVRFIEAVQPAARGT